MNQPVPAQVEVAADGAPRAVRLRQRRRSVAATSEVWRVDEGWWRPHPVSRRYFRLVLDDGQQVVVYQDLLGGDWWAQRY